MKVKDLLCTLKCLNPEYDIYISVYLDNRRALYGPGFEGAAILEDNEIFIENNKNAICFNCSIEETNKILKERENNKRTGAI